MIIINDISGKYWDNSAKIEDEKNSGYNSVIVKNSNRDQNLDKNNSNYS